MKFCIHCGKRFLLGKKKDDGLCGTVCRRVYKARKEKIESGNYTWRGVNRRSWLK